jgi:lipoyl(octanoyl) transferase
MKPSFEITPPVVAQPEKLCEVLFPGVVPYKEAVVLQESYVEKIASGRETEKLILLEHPHVITLGRGFHPSNLLASEEWLAERGISVEESGRGGDVTYHGPGQVVGYPLLRLKEQPDLHQYLRNLEELMIRAVADFGIKADRKQGLTGIWTGEEKLGAIGVRVARWVTSHGFALNVNTNLQYFQHIVPCGIRQYGVTSIQKLLDREIPMQEVHASLILHFQEIFRRRVVNHLD